MIDSIEGWTYLETQPTEDEAAEAIQRRIATSASPLDFTIRRDEDGVHIFAKRKD